MFDERRGDCNCITKEHHSNSEKNPQSAGHTNEQNYPWVVVYSALQKRYILPDFPVIVEKVLWKGGGDYTGLQPKNCIGFFYCFL
jgi:hypothetical protein